MKISKEITVRVNEEYEQLHNNLVNQGFKIVEKFNLNDIYLINNDIDIFNMKVLDLLNKCVLVREVVGITKKLVYKYKEYDNDGSILEQGKTECEILDINDSVNLFKKLGYKELIKIYDKCIVYTNNKIELVVQIVNNKYIFIEMEDKAVHIDKTFDTIKSMISALEKYDIDYDKTDYFVKKAEIIYNDKYNK